MPPNTPLQPTSTPTPNPPAPTSADIVNKLPASAQKVLNKNSLWIIIALALVSIFSVTFGIYQMIESSHAKERVSSLESELEEKNKLIVQYGAALGLDVSQSNKPGNSSKPSEDKTEPSLIASKDYIYIGEWGIKIKIPNGLKNVSYVFNDDLYPEQDGYKSDASSICATGILDDMAYTPESFRIHNNRPGFGCLARISKEELIHTGQASADDKNLPDYSYIYSGPQAVTGINGQEITWELEIVKLVKEMLSNPDNQSKF